MLSLILDKESSNSKIIGNSEEDNRGRRGGRSYDSGFSFYFSPTDLFWYVLLTDIILTSSLDNAIISNHN